MILVGPTKPHVIQNVLVLILLRVYSKLYVLKGLIYCMKIINNIKLLIYFNLELFYFEFKIIKYFICTYRNTHFINIYYYIIINWKTITFQRYYLHLWRKKSAKNIHRRYNFKTKNLSQLNICHSLYIIVILSI